jgi:DAACS family dicarboxylate/amino acid:cation (Na+ or H+) symporter
MVLPAKAQFMSDEARPRPSHKHQSALPILLGLLAGLVLGLIANALGMRDGRPDRWVALAIAVAQPVGKVFLRLMFMVVVPFVFAALSLAIVEIGEPRRLGRLGLKTLVLTGVFSATAVLIGVTLVNVFQPGHVLSEQQRTQLAARYEADSARLAAHAKQAKSFADTLVDMLPENPLQEMVGAVDGSSKGNGMLAVMCFALCGGLAISARREECQTLVAWLQGVQAAAMVIIGFALKLAPVGAGCLVFAITAQLGMDILRTLFWFAATVIAGLLLQLFGTYSAMLVSLSRRSPWQFYRDVSPAMLTAFATSSSNATLPTAIRVADDELKLPQHVSRFVLTVGATGNQNGTALYEGVVILFLAQVMGVELNFGQQLQVVLMSILAGIGTAGIPGGSLPLVMVVMRSVGVPPESIAIILGIDRLLDMCRTVVNVTGDLAVATCVADAEPAPAPPVESA